MANASTPVVMPTNARVEWQDRSIRLVQPHEKATSSDYTVTTNSSVGQMEVDGVKTPGILMVVDVSVTDKPIEARLSVRAEFVFQDRKRLTTKQATEFVVEYGFEYVLGYIRSALLDSVRLFRKSMLIPIVPRDQVRQWVHVERATTGPQDK